MSKLIDGGAPMVSACQAEFEHMAIYWQDEARRASEQASRYMMLADGLSQTYRSLMKEALLGMQR